MKLFNEIFKPHELVSKKHYDSFDDKELIYNLFDVRLKKTIEFIRNRLDKELFVNDWAFSKAKKVYNYRGYRWIDCNEGAPKSAHKSGQGLDFIVKGMTAKEFRTWIRTVEDELPYPIRIEDGVSWNHLDIKEVKGVKVYFFKVK